MVIFFQCIDASMDLILALPLSDVVHWRKCSMLTSNLITNAKSDRVLMSTAHDKPDKPEATKAHTAARPLLLSTNGVKNTLYGIFLWISRTNCLP
jgi:hypothetical protein